MRSVRRVPPGVIAATALVVTIGGCGSSPEGDAAPVELDADGATAAATLSRQLQADGDLTAADADCVSTRWVDVVGPDALVDAGLISEDYTTPETTSSAPGRDVVEAYADAYFDCVDYGRLEAEKFDRTRPDHADLDAFAACANAIDRNDAEQALIDDLLGEESDVADAVHHQLIQCATGE